MARFWSGRKLLASPCLCRLALGVALHFRLDPSNSSSVCTTEAAKVLLLTNLFQASIESASGLRRFEGTRHCTCVLCQQNTATLLRTFVNVVGFSGFIHSSQIFLQVAKIYLLIFLVPLR